MYSRRQQIITFPLILLIGFYTSYLWFSRLMMSLIIFAKKNSCFINTPFSLSLLVRALSIEHPVTAPPHTNPSHTTPHTTLYITPSKSKSKSKSAYTNTRKLKREMEKRTTFISSYNCTLYAVRTTTKQTEHAILLILIPKLGIWNWNNALAIPISISISLYLKSRQAGTSY